MMSWLLFFRYSCMVFEIASSELGVRVSFFRLGKLIMRVYEGLFTPAVFL